MKIFYLLLIITIAIAECRQFLFEEPHYQDSFIHFMKTHRKSYAHDEFPYRYQVFKQNMDFIAAHNDKKLSYSLAMNHFGDYTHEEFQTFILGTKPSIQANLLGNSGTLKATGNSNVPDAFDWREKGAVTPVKNQGHCGSCWSFSSSGAVEGCHFLAKQKLVSLSEQNLIDCSWDSGNQGCHGGLMTAAFDYIISNKGIVTEESYPYTAQASHTCKFNSTNVGATLSSYQTVEAGNEPALLEAVAKGPVSVAIDASQKSFQFYSSGIYYDSGCSATNLDHGVLVVGWGKDADSKTEAGTDFWLVKNSWSSTWGLEGYIKMARNKDNHCGIASMATLPIC